LHAHAPTPSLPSFPTRRSSDLLHDAGLYAIVDLHWSAQGTLPADGRTGQGRQMADRDHAPAFWRSVASVFRSDPAVVFDLFNERSEEHTSELQSLRHLVCRLLL